MNTQTAQPNSLFDQSITQPIAVIGIGCCYPGAATPRALWENILARRQQFRRMPDVRLPIADYHSNERATPDKTYGLRAAVIDGYAFDWMQRRIPKQTYEATDMAHWLALDVALQMLADAGYDAARLPRDSTLVVVGNTLTGEFTRANTLRTRWPYVNKVLQQCAADLQLPATALSALSRHMEHCYKSAFPPVNEDTLAGGLANTIAGRICNYLNVHGGGYVVDGACSSSLIAVYQAAAHLANGSADFAIAGGVDISLDPFELVGFAKTGALTPTQMAVYDKRGNGFIPGEGCGFVGLKRLADARRDGDSVYAVLDGWGMSSDGKGGITAPSADGQSLALRRAYRLAGITPEQLDFIEGHGTGTAVGDKTELLGIAHALDMVQTKRNCGVTSFKSIVGHTKAAAGIGAFIKAVMAVNQRVVPPTAGCSSPHDLFATQAAALYPVMRGAIQSADKTLRAGVSAMGFGGINVHVTLHSGDAPRTDLGAQLDARAALVSAQDSEVFCFAAATLHDLQQAITALRDQALAASAAELADLAAHCNRQASQHAALRAALVAGSVEELYQRAALLLAKLNTPLQAGAVVIDDEQGLVLSHHAAPLKLGYLFPGQGSQRLNAARVLVERFAWARQCLAAADECAQQLGTAALAASLYPDLDRHVTAAEREPLLQQLKQTQLAQPAIALASLLWLKYLQRLGISAQVVVGHSLGELTAFHAAGAFDEATLLKLATLRGILMATTSAPSGAMLSLSCAAEVAGELIASVVRESTQAGAAQAILVIANRNSATQTVVAGDHAAVQALAALAQSRHIEAQWLPVSHAFHSPLVADAARGMHAQAPLPDQPYALDKLLVSSCDGSLVDEQLDLREHFATQITRPVDFIAAVRQLQQHCQLAVEVGPGGVLTRLAQQTVSAQRVQLCSIEAKPESFAGLNWLVALAHTQGRAINWDELYAARIIRPLVSAAQRQFIVNPCERELDRLTPTDAERLAAQVQLAGANTGSFDLAEYLSARGDAVADFIQRDAQARAAGTLHQYAAHAVAPKWIADSATDLSGTDLMGADLTGVSHAAVSNDREVEHAVKQVVAALTGFAVDSLVMTLSITDDLNIDSIKFAELAARLTERFAAHGATEQGFLQASTVQDLVAVARRLTDPATAAGPTAQVAVSSLLMELAARYTGFAPDSLQQHQSLVDDLNLDSIKLAGLIDELCARLGISGKLQAGEVGAATLGELAARVESLLPTSVQPAPPTLPSATSSAAAASAAQPDQADWVRSFEMVLVPATVDREAGAKAFVGQSIAIQCAPSERELAQVIAAQLAQRGATVELLSAEQLASSDLALQSIVVLLQRQPAALTPTAEVAQLQAAAVLSARCATCRSLTYVQFDGLAQGSELIAGRAGACGAVAFAASIHLERPDFKVRVIDFISLHEDAFVAGKTLVEMVADERYVLSHYGAGQQRYERVAQRCETHGYPNRRIDWSDGDVVLVTGGAKGITAECALAFSQTTRARMVLVGSSPAPAAAQATEAIAGEITGEIAATLNRYAALGLTAEYRQCDITDTTAVAQLLTAVAREVGQVTGIIHGAGVNKPRRVEQCSLAEAVAEIAPKLQGMRNLLNALPVPPKLLVGFTSIIGVTGMPGNAWYAFANEMLNSCLHGYRQQQPTTQVVSLAFSVWDEIGMGAKLDSTRHLAKLGIGAIAPRLGVAHFLSSVLKQSPALQMVIASRLGGLDTWRQATQLPAQRGRFIEDIVAFEPGVELVARARLTLNDDRYLRDHYYRGVYLFPTVFGLEAMAQAVAAVLGLPAFDSLRIEDILLERPIVVGGKEGTEIRLSATVMERSDATEPRRVQVGIRTQATAFKRDHFAATFVLGSLPISLESPVEAMPATPLDIEPRTELYGGMLFQGPLFQRLRAVRHMSSAGAWLDIERRMTADYFAPEHSAHLLLGDPSYRDVLLQSAQLAERDTYLPVRIDALHIVSLRAGSAGVELAHNQITGRAGDDLSCQVLSLTAEGEPSEFLHGYRLKRMQRNEHAPSPEEFVDPARRDAQHFAQTLDAACARLAVQPPGMVLSYYPQLASMEKGRRHLNELPIFSEAIMKTVPNASRFSEQLEIHWQADGKPVLHGLPHEQMGVDSFNVSLAHDRTHCLCVAGVRPQGCDIEPITPRTERMWLGLIGAARRVLLQQLIKAGDSLDEAGTRIWCLLESVKKATGDGNATLRLVRRDAGAVLFTATRASQAAAPLWVLTASVQLTRPPAKMVGVVVEPLPQTVAEPTAAQTWPRLANHAVGSDDAVDALDANVRSRMLQGPAGQLQPCFRFRTTFKDVTTASHGLDFPAFANWMGTVRELGIVAVANQLVPDFASGRWGMVTNHSEIALLAPAQCLDVIEGRMYLRRSYGKFGSSVDMNFSWYKIHRDGREELIGLSRMATTWVEITGHGVVEVKPFPAYLQDFLINYLPAPGAQLSADESAALHDGAPRALLGEVTYSAPNAPGMETCLQQEIFATTSAESNLVGNIYFSHYYAWQRKLIDRYLHAIEPGFYAASTQLGEFRCLHASVQHLREAMPFDRIEVTMALKSLHENGVTWQFEYYKIGEDAARIKLAVGEHQAIWVDAGANALASAPTRYLDAMLAAVTEMA